MVITEFLERNARLYGAETALVEINPSEERDRAVTWREASLIESAQPDAPYRRALSWRDFDRRANRFANLLLSRGMERGAKVGILMMNCLEWLPVYFGILKAGCIAVPLNFRYSSEEIKYCLELADVEFLVFGPEFVGRMDTVQDQLPQVRMMFFVGRDTPAYAEDCLKLMGFCSSSPPPVSLEEADHAAIYFSSGTTGFPKAILHNHRALTASCQTEQRHHGQTREDVFLCIPPLYHTGAKMHWFGSLLSGSRAVLLRGVKPEWILRAVTEEKCTIVWLLVPWAQDPLEGPLPPPPVRYQLRAQRVHRPRLRSPGCGEHPQGGGHRRARLPVGDEDCGRAVERGPPGGDRRAGRQGSRRDAVLL